MKNVLKIIAALILFAATSCIDADKTSPGGITTTVINQAVLDSATVLIVESTDHSFDSLNDAQLVYKDSLFITNNSSQTYGEPIISLYEKGKPLRHLADYIPCGSDIDEMVACRIAITGNKLFVNDCYYTGRYCTISLEKPLLPANELHLIDSGVEERGVASTPFRNGLLVENPQCYSDDEADIHNDVPRLLYYQQGRCQTLQKDVAYQVADVNTGADIHYNDSCQRICFVSQRQPLVEFYDDSLRLVHRLTLQSDDAQKIHIGKPKTTMRQKRTRGEITPAISATFDKTQRVVGAGNQLHAFLCSAADNEHIYLVYCGKLFSHEFHTYPSYILVLNWDGRLVETYQFNRWIQAISPSSETGTFYLTVYTNDDCNSSRTKLVKAIPQRTVEKDSLTTKMKPTRHIHQNKVRKRIK